MDVPDQNVAILLRGTLARTESNLEMPDATFVVVQALVNIDLFAG